MVGGNFAVGAALRVLRLLARGGEAQGGPGIGSGRGHGRRPRGRRRAETAGKNALVGGVLLALTKASAS